MVGNFSMPELLIVGALALIVIGPKDLPRMMRAVGKFVGQARGMAREFQRSMDDAAREVDLREFKDAKALMDKKSGTKTLTDTLSKSVGLDDDEDTEKPKSPTMTDDEMAEAVKKFSDGKKSTEQSALPETDTASADPEPAKASQG